MKEDCSTEALDWKKKKRILYELPGTRLKSCAAGVQFNVAVVCTASCCAALWRLRCGK